MSDLAHAVCAGLKAIEYPLGKIPGTLLQGDQVLATGKARIETSEHFSTFWPTDEKQSDIPDRGVTLKLTDNPRAIPITNLHWCGKTSSHYHFDLAS